ncbi:MAG: TolC family protein [Pirellulaceae bacterium]
MRKYILVIGICAAAIAAFVSRERRAATSSIQSTSQISTTDKERLTDVDPPDTRLLSSKTNTVGRQTAENEHTSSTNDFVVSNASNNSAPTFSALPSSQHETMIDLSPLPVAEAPNREFYDNANQATRIENPFTSGLENASPDGPHLIVNDLNNFKESIDHASTPEPQVSETSELETIVQQDSLTTRFDMAVATDVPPLGIDEHLVEDTNEIDFVPSPALLEPDSIESAPTAIAAFPPENVLMPIEQEPNQETQKVTQEELDEKQQKELRELILGSDDQSENSDATPENEADSTSQPETQFPLDKPLGNQPLPTTEPQSPLSQGINAISTEPSNDSLNQFSPNPAIDNATSGSDTWTNRILNPILGTGQSEFLDVQRVIYLTLENSQKILALSQEPLIAETDIQSECAKFDPNLFAKSIYDDRVDPVGNTLTTGGLPFLEDNIWTGTAGVRKKTATGGNVELQQKLGFQNSNSRFFTPQDQGTAVLSLNFEQPLRRNRGRYITRSQILIAETSTGLQWDELSTKIQNELLEAVSAYWELYLARANYVQKQDVYHQGRAILTILEGRQEFDAQAIQIAQARSAVRSRETELANALRDIRLAEAKLRRLMGFGVGQHAVELVTSEMPGGQHVTLGCGRGCRNGDPKPSGTETRHQANSNRGGSKQRCRQSNFARTESVVQYICRGTAW